MHLVVDIGNSTVHVGLGSNGNILREARFVPGVERAALAPFLDKFLRLRRGDVREIGVASVQPDTLAALRAHVADLGVPLRVVGEDLPVPLTTAYGDPSTLGIDRLVDAYSVRRRFDGARVIVNFGTAVTVDAVTVDGRFHSGAILPGLWLSLNGLARDAAQLPAIGSVQYTGFPTTSTQEAMVTGLLVGMAGMVDRVARELAAAVSIDCRAVATGGDAARLAPLSEVIDEVVPSLTLLGILDLMTAQEPAGS